MSAGLSNASRVRRVTRIRPGDYVVGLDESGSECAYRVDSADTFHDGSQRVVYLLLELPGGRVLVERLAARDRVYVLPGGTHRA